jgi:hypothetical protein
MARGLTGKETIMKSSIIEVTGEVGGLASFFGNVAGQRLPSGTEENISRLISQAMSLDVNDDATCQNAYGLLFLCREIDKEIKEYFRPYKEDIARVWKSLCDAESSELLRLKHIVDNLMAQIYTYNPDFNFSCDDKAVLQ